MNGKELLLDTNIVISLFKGNQGIVKRLNKSTRLFIPSIVAGELIFGAKNSTNKEKHNSQVELFLNACQILPVDKETAQFYGSLKSKLKSIGKPIPENDIWIASLSIQYQLPLFSADNHFKTINNIQLIQPT